MKTLVKYKLLAGGDGEALINGAISDITQAKRELANTKSLSPSDAGEEISDDIDSLLRDGGIDPNSLTFVNISE